MSLFLSPAAISDEAKYREPDYITVSFGIQACIQHHRLNVRVGASGAGKSLTFLYIPSSIRRC
jgi:hypothetical protein